MTCQRPINHVSAVAGAALVIGFSVAMSDARQTAREDRPVARIDVGRLARTPVLRATRARTAGRLSPRSRLSVAGLGPVKIGMSKAEAERAGRVRLKRLGPTLHECFNLAPSDRSIRAGFMVVRGKIARVDVGRGGIRTTSGFRVGDSEHSVRERFAGRLRVSRHVYYRSGWYLEVTPRTRAQRGRRLVFETNDGRVIAIRAGRLPEARYVEGCV